MQCGGAGQQIFAGMAMDVKNFCSVHCSMAAHESLTNPRRTTDRSLLKLGGDFCRFRGPLSVLLLNRPLEEANTDIKKFFELTTVILGVLI